MEQEDLVQIERMLTRVVDAKLEQVQKDFSHQVVMQAELTQNKLDLIVEGQQALAERMDRFDGRMDGIEHRLERVEVRVAAVEKKVDGVSADLSAHRRDTEAHRKGYSVREE
jgi:predicted nuclease with TOPRIM domain